jgi:hypothetical protein
MISVELKDKVLSIIVDNAPELFAGFNTHEMAKVVGSNSKVIDALLREYENRGFMKVNRMLGGGVHCNIEIRAHDFLKSGGYIFEETIASIQLEKLKREIESLEGSISNTKYDTIMSSVTTLASALGLQKG